MLEEELYLLTYRAEPFLRSCQLCSHSGRRRALLREKFPVRITSAYSHKIAFHKYFGMSIDI
jgi:hypothetical protein